jgi:hypothetical protein
MALSRRKPFALIQVEGWDDGMVHSSTHSLPCASKMWNKELQEQLAVYEVAIVDYIVLPVDRH